MRNNLIVAPDMNPLSLKRKAHHLLRRRRRRRRQLLMRRRIVPRADVRNRGVVHVAQLHGRLHPPLIMQGLFARRLVFLLLEAAAAILVREEGARGC